MGLFDGAQQRKADTAEMASAVIAGCPDAGHHYLTHVNKGGLSHVMLQGLLNSHYAKGYRLAQAFEQAGNTVTVFEHNHG